MTACLGPVTPGAERAGLEAENLQWRQVVDDLESQLAAKDRRIEELEQRLEVMRARADKAEAELDEARRMYCFARARETGREPEEVADMNDWPRELLASCGVEVKRG